MENQQVHTAAYTITSAEVLYDLSMLKEMDDDEYLLEILTILLKETPKDLKEMMEALKLGNTDTICQKAHKLKSSAGIIQAKKFGTQLEAIETAGKNGIICNELISLVENATQQYTCIENLLKTQVDGLNIIVNT